MLASTVRFNLAGQVCRTVFFLLHNKLFSTVTIKTSSSQIIKKINQQSVSNFYKALRQITTSSFSINFLAATPRLINKTWGRYVEGVVIYVSRNTLPRTDEATPKSMCINFISKSWYGTLEALVEQKNSGSSISPAKHAKTEGDLSHALLWSPSSIPSLTYRPNSCSEIISTQKESDLPMTAASCQVNHSCGALE